MIGAPGSSGKKDMSGIPAAYQTKSATKIAPKLLRMLPPTIGAVSSPKLALKANFYLVPVEVSFEPESLFRFIIGRTSARL